MYKIEVKGQLVYDGDKNFGGDLYGKVEFLYDYNIIIFIKYEFILIDWGKKFFLFIYIKEKKW